MSYKSDDAGVANKFEIVVQSKLLRLLERGVSEAKEEEEGVAATFMDVVAKFVKGDVFVLLLLPLLLTLTPLLLVVVQ